MFGVSGNSPAQPPRTGFCFHCNQVTELGFRSNGKPAKLCHTCLVADRTRRESINREHVLLLQQRDAEIHELRTKLAAAEAEIKELRGVLVALKSSLELYC